MPIHPSSAPRGGPGLLLFAGAGLTLAELTAARLDGDVVELGEAYLPADAAETPTLRARSLAPLVTPDVALIHASAAWVHGALAEPPARHSLQRAVPWRLHQRWGRRFVYRDARIPAEDVVSIGGVGVATVERTIADLLRRAEPGDRELAASLARGHPAAVTASLAWVDGHRSRAGTRAARETLRAWRRGDQDEVTR